MVTFAVLTHGDPLEFHSLAESLSPSRVVVHVDARTPITNYKQFPHVEYTEERLPIHWGGFSMIRATLLLYRRIVATSTDPNDHVVLLSGRCALIRPVEDLVDYLSSAPWRQHCKGGLLLDGVRQHEDRVRKSWHFDRFDSRDKGRLRAFWNRTLRSLTRMALPRKTDRKILISPIAGSQWTALTTGCIRDILAREDLLLEAERTLKHAVAPDEIFFHSLVYATEWRTQTESPDPQPVGNRLTSDFANLHYIHHSLTYTVDPRDLEVISTTGAFFARKVDFRRFPDTEEAVKSARRKHGLTI